jgi:hypothetical protein
MTRTSKTQNPRRGHRNALLQAVAVAVVGLTLAAADTAQAQQALGVPFVGRNHLSVSVTELSRDGVGTEQAAVFGGVYGRRFNGDDATLQFSAIVRAAARAFQGTEDGIAEAGLTLAASHRVRAIEGLSLTGAAGVGAVVWGQDGPQPAEPDQGRVIARIPLSAGMAYDLRAGRATIAPFVSMTGAYSRERDYANSLRIAEASGWRLGHTAGVSVRFRETVVSLSSVSRERGMPNRNRMVFSAGMSW